MDKVETLKLLIKTLRTELLVLETTLVGVLRTPYCLVGADGYIAGASPEFLRHVGLAEHELVGKHCELLREISQQPTLAVDPSAYSLFGEEWGTFLFGVTTRGRPKTRDWAILRVRRGDSIAVLIVAGKFNPTARYV